MKNSTLLYALVVSLFVAAPVTPAVAAPFSFHKEVRKNQCDDPQGKVVINVTQKIVDDVDSGQAGNNWAFDAINRHIQVWLQEDGDYCALVSYEGKFDAQAGQTSPGNTGLLTGDEDGKFKGGYRATISGTLKSNPVWATHGNVGTFNYDCDILGNCPGYVSWTKQYFDSGYGFNYGWWGWEYKGPQGHTWINSVDGNSGDVM